MPTGVRRAVAEVDMHAHGALTARKIGAERLDARPFHERDKERRRDFRPRGISVSPKVVYRNRRRIVSASSS